jgi:hypothetical protein
VCWTGYTWDAKYFPDPAAFFRWCDTRGLKNALNLHLSSGVQVWLQPISQCWDRREGGRMRVGEWGRENEGGRMGEGEWGRENEGGRMREREGGREKETGGS